MKGTVRLRERAMKSGKKSLYLDVYAGWRRTYEYLGLYLIPESTAADKKANRETMALARAVEAKRIVELKSSRFGLVAWKENMCMDMKPSSVSTYMLWSRRFCARPRTTD